MAESFAEFLKRQAAIRRGEAQPEIPGRKFTPDLASVAARRNGFYPELIPNTSGLPKSGGLEINIDETPEPSEKKNYLTPALTGAAYGIQANVGAPIPGQEFTQGILKGVIGGGMAAAAESRLEAARNKGAADLAGKMALIDYRTSKQPTSDQKMEDYQKRLDMRQEDTLEAIAAREKSAISRAKSINALEKASGWSQKELAKLKAGLIGKSYQLETTPALRDEWVEIHYQDLLSGLGELKVPDELM